MASGAAARCGAEHPDGSTHQREHLPPTYPIERYREPEGDEEAQQHHREGQCQAFACGMPGCPGDIEAQQPAPCADAAGQHPKRFAKESDATSRRQFPSEIEDRLSVAFATCGRIGAKTQTQNGVPQLVPPWSLSCDGAVSRSVTILAEAASRAASSSNRPWPSEVSR